MDCVVLKHNKKKKHKRKKDNEDGNSYASTELCVDSEVSKKQNNEKDLSDNHLVVKKKKKKKLVEEHNIEENTTSVDTMAIQASEENRKNKKRKKKQQENECETLHTSVDVIPEASKKYKKRKHMLQNDELEGVGNVLECEGGINILEPPTKKKKKKKKHIDESEIKEEVLLPVKEIDTVELKGDQLLQSNGHIKATERILTKIDTLIEDNVKRKKHKSNNKENKSKNMHISPYLHKKKKHNLENEEQYSERTDATVISKKKKKKKKSERKENNCDLTKLEPEDEASSSLLVAPENKKSSEIGAQKRQKSTSKHKKETKRDVSKLKDTFSLWDLDSDDCDALNEEVACLEEQAQSIKDKNRLSCEEEKKLSDLRIMVPWPVPPLHMIETRITMRPNQTQAEKIKELGVEVKSAQYYSKVEDEQLTKNWHKFCKLHDLPQDPKPFHNMVNPDGQNIVSVPERLNFVRFLAHNLNDRLLCSVYKRFRRLFPAQQLKTGSRFSPEEDQLIMKYIKKSSSRTPYADLGALLGRNKFAVEKRARILVEEANYGNLDVKWSTERIEEFVKHVVDVTKVANVNELQNRQIEQKEWRHLEKKLNIPVRKLQKGWACRIFPTLFAKDHSSTMQVKRSLVRILLERGENDFKTVDWTLIQKELGKDADGFTGRGLHELLQGMIYHIVPPKMRNDSKACLEYLNRAFENGEIRGRRLKKFTPMATEA